MKTVSATCGGQFYKARGRQVSYWGHGVVLSLVFWSLLENLQVLDAIFLEELDQGGNECRVVLQSQLPFAFKCQKTASLVRREKSFLADSKDPATKRFGREKMSKDQKMKVVGPTSIFSIGVILSKRNARCLSTLATQGSH